ncbi:hypothetical protein TNCV_4367311 [Trichonephila clavipes]|nr:hypothetical protein TNCV_4367311 [Trichonephila clavipes]
MLTINSSSESARLVIRHQGTPCAFAGLVPIVDITSRTLRTKAIGSCLVAARWIEQVHDLDVAHNCSNI